MKFLIEYLIDSTLRLPDDEPPQVIRWVDGTELTLSNGKDAQRTTDAPLVGHLTFEAASLADAKAVADDLIAAALNALVFATASKFKVREARCLFDWTPGLSERDAHYYAEVPTDQRVNPEFTPEFTHSVQHWVRVQGGERQQRALRWYRRGVTAEGLEDQFTYFWFALEIASEFVKDREKVPSACPHCRGPLYCEPCGIHPVHAKYPGQAIRAAIQKYVQSDPDLVFNALQKIRHALMHGDRIASVIEDLPFDEISAVNWMEQIARMAVTSMFRGNDPDPPDQITMGYRDNIARQSAVMCLHVRVGMLGADPRGPRPEDIPNIEITMTDA